MQHVDDCRRANRQARAGDKCRSCDRAFARAGIGLPTTAACHSYQAVFATRP